MSIPVVESARLRLRPHTKADFDAMATMWSDPEVVRHIGGRPSARDETWMRLLRYVGHWSLLGYGYWAIEEKASGRFVGEGGFADFMRDTDPAVEPPEQGWALTPDVFGKGYATEAVAAMIAWAEPHFGRRDFTCMISPGNAASIRVAEKNGYREYARADYKGSPSLLFRRSA